MMGALAHRHLDYDRAIPPAERGLAAIDDLLDRGDLEDWAPLARAVADDPWGEVADVVLHLVTAHPMYGTSPLWRSWVMRCRLRALRCEAVGLAALRQAADLSQTRLAGRLAVGQPIVSRTEASSNLRLDTLRRYVVALGGEVRVQARFADTTVDLDL